MSPAGLYGRRDSGTSGLTWGYYGGIAFGNTVADGSVSLTASSTNYVVASRSTGAVSVSTSNTNWNNTTGYARLYQVVTGSAAVTSFTDYRDFMAGGGFTNPMTTAGDMIIGGASGAPARLPVGTDGQILKVVSGAPAYADPSAGDGDVVGPSSSVADRIALFDGTTGKLLKDSGETVASIRSVPQNSQSNAYTMVLSDAGKHILHPSADTTARTFTIPANASVAYPIGTAITIVNQNGAGVITIAITSDTMRLAGAGTTGSRSLAANGIATALKISSTEWLISGTGLS